MAGLSFDSYGTERRLAISLVAKLGFEGAIDCCQANPWDEVLKWMIALKESDEPYAGSGDRCGVGCRANRPTGHPTFTARFHRVLMSELGHKRKSSPGHANVRFWGKSRHNQAKSGHPASYVRCWG